MLPDSSNVGLEGNVVILGDLRHVCLRVSNPSSDWPHTRICSYWCSQVCIERISTLQFVFKVILTSCCLR